MWAVFSVFLHSYVKFARFKIFLMRSYHRIGEVVKSRQSKIHDYCAIVIPISINILLVHTVPRDVSGIVDVITIRRGWGWVVKRADHVLRQNCVVFGHAQRHCSIKDGWIKNIRMIWYASIGGQWDLSLFNFLCDYEKNNKERQHGTKSNNIWEKMLSEP